VILPAGFKGQLSSLTVSSGVDTQPVSASGSFALTVTGPGEVLVTLQNSSGSALLMGYADAGSNGTPESGGNGKISATTTAEVLMFYGLEGFLAPSAEWTQLRQLILQTPQITTLASTISSRVVANSTALAGGDQQISAAAISACQNIAGSSVPAQMIASNAPQKGRNFSTTVSVVANPRDTGNTATHVEPSGEFSGIEVQNNPKGDGIIFVNHFRRRCVAYIYETATQASGGTLTNVAKPIPLTNASATLVGSVGGNLGLDTGGNSVFEIAATNRPNGLFGSITDLLFSNGAYTPTGSTALDLPLATGTIRTDYTIVVLGPSVSSSLSSFPPTLDPRFAPEVPQWNNSLTVLNYETGILDVALPMLGSIPLPKLPSFPSLNPTQLQGIFAFVVTTPSFAHTIEIGDFKGMVQKIITNTATSKGLREGLFKAIWTQTFGAGTFQEQLALANQELAQFFGVVTEVNIILTAFDEAVIAASIASSNAGESWIGTEISRSSHLTPATTTVDQKNPGVVLTTSPGNQPTGVAQYYYHYAVAGSAGGHIIDSTHTSGADTSFFSTDSTITYGAGIRAMDGQADTVTVTVYLNNGTNAKPVQGEQIGTATSVITFQTSGPCGAFPAAVPGTGASVSFTPSTVAPGGTLTMSIQNTAPVINPGGTAFKVFLGFIDNIETTSITVDGQTQLNGEARVPDDNAVHTVKFVISPNQTDVCPGTKLVGNGGAVGFYTGSWIYVQGVGGQALGGQPFPGQFPFAVHD
jgi:hypothetical protein